MIQILALSHQGAPVHGISARFGEDGGTIGRANANELVLDGPDRTVSRIHARIVHRDGVWVIVDHGSNPTQLNGQLIGAGNEAVLSDGDRLQLGSYELLVSQAGHEADGREPGAGPDPWASSSAYASEDSTPAHLPDGSVDTDAVGFMSVDGPAAQQADDDPFAGLSLVALEPAAAPGQGASPRSTAVPAPGGVDHACVPGVSARSHESPADVPVLRQAAPAAAAHGDALLAAFLRGVGPLQEPIEALTPALMQRLGELLRSATEGTLRLLQTRDEFKQELRSQDHRSAAQVNNPLKLSPTVEVALAHLLGNGEPGLMPADAAMRDAYQDLRAHEFAIMVGIRTGLEQVLEQFEPDALEQDISAGSRLGAIFPANRKARLWDEFVELYADIARDAEEDFHSAFGRAFLKAYEEQMQRLKAAYQEGALDAD